MIESARLLPHNLSLPKLPFSAANPLIPIEMVLSSCQVLSLLHQLVPPSSPHSPVILRSAVQYIMVALS